MNEIDLVKVRGFISTDLSCNKLSLVFSAFIMGLGSFVNAFLSGDYAYYIAGIMAFIIGELRRRVVIFCTLKWMMIKKY